MPSRLSVRCPICDKANTICLELLERSGELVDLNNSLQQNFIVTIPESGYTVIEDVRIACINCNHNFGTEREFLEWLREAKKKVSPRLAKRGNKSWKNSRKK